MNCVVFSHEGMKIEGRKNLHATRKERATLVAVRSGVIVGSIGVTIQREQLRPMRQGMEEKKRLR